MDIDPEDYANMNETCPTCGLMTRRARSARQKLGRALSRNVPGPWAEIPSWRFAQLKRDYEGTNLSIRMLAEKHGMSKSVVQRFVATCTPGPARDNRWGKLPKGGRVPLAPGEELVGHGVAPPGLGKTKEAEKTDKPNSLSDFV